ncbi:hypothetical protein BGZ49_003977, partial [Haplosporangium sp. Z 27]
MTSSNSSSALSSRLIITALIILFSGLFFQWAFGANKDYLWANIKNVNRPIQYHGDDITSNFFEGWYFKLVKQDQHDHSIQHSMAIIVGIYRPASDSEDHIDGGGAHAFVIPLGLPGPEKFAYYRFPTQDFVDLSAHVHSEEFRIQLGNSIFAYNELILDLPIQNFDRIPAQELDSFYKTASSEYETIYLQSGSNASSIKLSQDFFRDFFPSSAQLKLQETQQQPFAIKGHFKFPDWTPLPKSPLVPSIMGLT